MALVEQGMPTLPELLTFQFSGGTRCSILSFRYSTLSTNCLFDFFFWWRWYICICISSIYDFLSQGLAVILIHTWRCENITASPCASCDFGMFLHSRIRSSILVCSIIWIIIFTKFVRAKFFFQSCKKNAFLLK